MAEQFGVEGRDHVGGPTDTLALCDEPLAHHLDEVGDVSVDGAFGARGVVRRLGIRGHVAARDPRRLQPGDMSADGADARSTKDTSPWIPRATCDASCVAAGAAPSGRPVVVAIRVAVRATFAVMLLSAVPLLAIPLPGRSHIQRGYCKMMLRALGVRITVSGGPIRNLRGVLVVSGHDRDSLPGSQTNAWGGCGE